MLKDPFISEIKSLQKQNKLSDSESHFCLEKWTADDKKMKMIFEAFTSNKDTADFVENLTRYHKRSNK